MKDLITSLIRHAVTAVVALFAYLSLYGWIEPGDAAAVETAGVGIGEGLVVILSAVAARLLIALAGRLKLSGLAPGNNGTIHGWFVPWVWIALAGLMGLSLPACTPAQREAFQALPIKGFIQSDYGRASYSSKGGLEFGLNAQRLVDRNSGK